MEEMLFTAGELHEDCNSGGARGRPYLQTFSLFFISFLMLPF